MALPKKKIYSPGSPGDERKKREITLSAIRKLIRSATNKTARRRDFQSRGLLGPL
jgi:hypothetical protein